MVNKTRMTTWIIAMLRYTLWYLIIGGTISFLLARNGQWLAAIIVFAVTLILIVTTVISQTRRLAHAMDRAQQRKAKRAAGIPR